MKTFVTFQVVFLSVILSTFYQEGVSGQSFYPTNPAYGGVPIIYDNSEDDDIGLLLTVLLLATRNRNSYCSCCNCYNSGNAAKSIPIPYPIPFPINNAIVNRSPTACLNNDDYDNGDGDDGDNNGSDAAGPDSGSPTDNNSDTQYSKTISVKFVPEQIPSTNYNT